MNTLRRLRLPALLGLRPFFLARNPFAALVEMELVGLFVLVGLSLLIGQLAAFAYFDGLLFLCAVCGMWMVLRTKVPTGSRRRQAVWEFGVAVLIPVVMIGGLIAPAVLFGWNQIWRAHMPQGDSVVLLLCVATGVGYLFTRVAVRAWLYWNRLRSSRLLWSMTHAHLVVVAVVAIIAGVGIMTLTPYGATPPAIAEEQNRPVIGVFIRVLVTIFPTVVISIVLLAGVLLAVLPPSALVSYLIARRTTRRLERLAAAAAAFRAGDYQARSPVQGQDEVAQLQADFNAMAQQLERTLTQLAEERDRVAGLLESRRDLVANVSHELRTPVATVRALLDSTLDREGRDPQGDVRHDLEIMSSEITRLQRLIDDLFAVARADAGRLELTVAPIDVVAVARRLVDAMSQLAWQTGKVEVITDLPDRLPAVTADVARLEQVLANLLRNAIRHTPPGGLVIVRAAAGDESVSITVCDTGEGIPPEDLPHLWDRFYRGTTARTRDAGGAGLGLALVKELTAAMGGTVSVESIPDQGSCFTVRLPLA